jgi:hypothetical protein
MGYYIQTGTTRGKALKLKEMFGAKIVKKAPAFKDIPKGKVLVVVVHNKNFEAAAVSINESEYNVFLGIDPHVRGNGDNRPLEFVLVDKKKAFKACGYKGEKYVRSWESDLPDDGRMLTITLGG